MATRTLSAQRWVVLPQENETYAMLEAATDTEAARLAYWQTHGYPTAVLATVTTTIETDPDA